MGSKLLRKGCLLIFRKSQINFMIWITPVQLITSSYQFITFDLIAALWDTFDLNQVDVIS